MLPKRKNGWDKNQQVNEEVNNDIELTIYESPILNEIDIEVPISNSKHLIRVYYDYNDNVHSIASLEQHIGYNEETYDDEIYYEATDFVINRILDIHLLDIKNLMIPDENNFGKPIATDLLVNLVELERQVSSIASDIDEVRWDNIDNY